jgi:hypothetical protein
VPASGSEQQLQVGTIAPVIIAKLGFCPVPVELVESGTACPCEAGEVRE